MPSGKLTCNFLDYVLEWVICEMTCLEDLIFPEFAVRWVVRLFWSVIPASGDAWSPEARRLVAYPTFEDLSNNWAIRIIRVGEVYEVGEAERPALVV